MKVLRAPSRRPYSSPFPEPLDPNAIIWRYVRIPALKMLIGNRELTLRRLTGFADQDRFEGKASIMDELELGVTFIRNRVGREHQLIKWQRLEVHRWIAYASCWRVDAHECGRAWADYHAEVAIRTTYSKLKMALPQYGDIESESDVKIGCVDYADRLFDMLPSHNWLFQLMTKANCYEWERELRVFKYAPEMFDQVHKELFAKGYKVPTTPEMIGVPIIWNDVIDELVAAPGSSDEIIREIQEYLLNSGVAVGVIKSRLY